MMKHGATDTTPEQETKINAYLLKISGHPRFNANEKQEIFLKYLESMDLTKEQVRNIFVNSTTKKGE